MISTGKRPCGLEGFCDDAKSPVREVPLKSALRKVRHEVAANPVFREHRRGCLVLMRWGIVPWFAKTEGEFKALSTINAKSDRLTDSKM